MSHSRPSGSAEQRYPGERLGLPEHGTGAVAGWLRRFGALVIDWVASSLVAVLVFGYTIFGATAGEQGWLALAPHLVFLLQVSFLTSLLGGSFGQLALRIGVARIDGRPVSLLQALLRTFLVLLVVPPLVFDRDQRGLHDLAAGTVALRR